MRGAASVDAAPFVFRDRTAHSKLNMATRRKQSNAPDIMIITGLSGSGMSSAINAFEDLGYFCVDNMPLTLVPTFARLVEAGDEEPGRIERAALVISFREGQFLSDFG